MSDALTSLIEQHEKEIWEFKQKESQWVRDKNQLDGNKRIIEELSQKIVDMNNRLKSALDINDEHQRYNGKLQTRLTEVEEDNKKLAIQIQDLTKSKQPF
jgi:ATP-dependent protease HslVU (ClpYQ) ATPase subunit